MRFSFNIIAAAALLLSSTAMAAYEHDLDAIIARHERDMELEARGETTEFELRAMLVERNPRGDCSTASPQRMTGPACARAGGHGWMSNGRCYTRQQMAMQGNVVKGSCYF
ncbi:hypothetical protein D9613_012383 [Agrocybe pediades]|uniref:Uncharacterized protein n=1 Tax=Agrocybe pediades TaxID=84607 RepID=A0A8H4QQZ5_9AGAR|nr:hypothetical protein D9613_012383 [Agrocybe pediades]KAF9550755.1 hypothetical protein CPC08DRAFT_823277 [Agrocybe pediades]